MRQGSIICSVLAVAGGYSIHEAEGSSGGVVGLSKSGCSCHGSKSSATVVSVYTDSTQILAGHTYVFSLSVANPSEKGAGCDLSVDNGGVLALDGTNSGLQFYNGELTHVGPRTFSGDSSVWTFKYTAPKTNGVAHIYAAGNAVNLDGRADAADHWNTIVYDVNVVSPAGVEEPASAAPSISLYPNPSKGIVTLSSSGLSGPAAITVSDASGRMVHGESVTLSGETNGETPLDLSSLHNGPYFLTVRASNGQSFTRSIVIAK